MFHFSPKFCTTHLFNCQDILFCWIPWGITIKNLMPWGHVWSNFRETVYDGTGQNIHKTRSCNGLINSRFGLLECARCFAGFKKLTQPRTPCSALVSQIAMERKQKMNLDNLQQFATICNNCRSFCRKHGCPQIRTLNRHIDRNAAAICANTSLTQMQTAIGNLHFNKPGHTQHYSQKCMFLHGFVSADFLHGSGFGCSFWSMLMFAPVLACKRVLPHTRTGWI